MSKTKTGEVIQAIETITKEIRKAKKTKAVLNALPKSYPRIEGLLNDHLATLEDDLRSVEETWIKS